MPLSRSFTKQGASGNKNLYSIEEADEGSLNSSSEDDVLELLTKGRPSSSSSVKKTSSSTADNKPSQQSTTSSSSSFISEQIGKLSKSVLEIQMKQHDDAATADETSKTILQRLSTNEANLSTILTGMQQLQLQMTSFDEELKQSNANHKETLLSLKVRLPSLFFRVAVLIHTHKHSSFYLKLIFRLQQRMKGDYYRLR